MSGDLDRPGADLTDGARIVDGDPVVDDATIEGALRPRTLDAFIGQQRVKDQLGVGARGSVGPVRAADHVPARRPARGWARPRCR